MTLAGLRPVLRRLLAVLTLAFGGLLWAAAPASAHAYLECADPAPDSTLDCSPSQLTLGFTEPVWVERGAVQVLDPVAGGSTPATPGTAVAVTRSSSTCGPTCHRAPTS